MARALKTQGTVVYYSIGSPTAYTALGNIVGMDGPGGQTLIIDKTNLDDGRTYRRKRTKLIDAGSLDLDLNLDPANAGHAAMKAAQESRSTLEMKISPASFSKSLYFDAQVKQFRMSGPADAKYKASISLLVKRGGFWWTDNPAPAPPVYATWDPAAKSARITLSNGNLTETSDGSLNFALVKSTHYKSTGKYYCELHSSVDRTNLLFGIANASASVDSYLGVDANGYSWGLNNPGYKYHIGGAGAYGFWTPARVSMLFDADAGTLSYWQGGIDRGVAFTGITGAWAPAISNYAGSSTSDIKFDPASWLYTPPAGYVGWSA